MWGSEVGVGKSCRVVGYSPCIVGLGCESGKGYQWPNSVWSPWKSAFLGQLETRAGFLYI